MRPVFQVFAALWALGAMPQSKRTRREQPSFGRPPREGRIHASSANTGHRSRRPQRAEHGK